MQCFNFKLWGTFPHAGLPCSPHSPVCRSIEFLGDHLTPRILAENAVHSQLSDNAGALLSNLTVFSQTMLADLAKWAKAQPAMAAGAAVAAVPASIVGLFVLGALASVLAPVLIAASLIVAVSALTTTSCPR